MTTDCTDSTDLKNVGMISDMEFIGEIIGFRNIEK